MSTDYKLLRNLNEQDFGISRYTPSDPTLPRTSSFHLVLFPSDFLPPEVGGKSMVLKWELLSPPKSFTNWSACPFFLSGHTSAPYCQGHLLSTVVCHQLYSFTVSIMHLLSAYRQVPVLFHIVHLKHSLLWLYGKLHCTPVWLPLTCPLFCNSTLNECVVYTQVPGHRPVCRHSFILVP